MRIKLYASIIALAFFASSPTSYAQCGDDPCSPTPLTVTANGPCTYVNCTNIGATPSGVNTGPCSGVNNNDVWYSFTVPAGVTTLLGQVLGGTPASGRMDYPIVYFYRGPCTALTTLGCNTGFPPGSTGSFMYTSFVPGETIWVRVKPLGGTSDGAFSLCVYNPCPSGPPANDNPCSATVVPMTANCAGYTAISNFCATATGDYISQAGATSSGTTITVSSTIGLYPGMPVDVAGGVGAFAAGTTVVSITNATTFVVSAAPTIALSGGSSIVAGQGPPAPGCANFQGGDIWLQTTVGANGHIEVNFQQQSLADPGVAIYSGTCSNLVLEGCNDDAGPGLMPYLFLINPLLANQTVWIRVWDYGGNNFGTMNICITDPCPSGAAVNDEPCGATFIPMTATPCTNFTTLSTTCASASSGVPTPSCGNYQGGDVWMSTTVGANGHLAINTRQNTLFSGGVAIYIGPCNALTEVACAPTGFAFGMPFLYTNSLPAGATVYIRFWVPGNFTTGSFDICLSDPCPSGTVIPPIFDDPPCPPPATPAGYLPFTAGPCTTFTNYTSVCSNTGLSNSPLPVGTADPVGCSGPFYPPNAFLTANWDVWAPFIIPTVPPSGFIDINTQPGTVNDLDIAIYRINGGYANNCNNPAAYQMLMCDDLNGPVFMPYLHLPYGGANPVQPGDTILIRMWDYFGSTPGNWGMCINNPCPGGTVPPPAYDDPPCPAAAQLLPVTGGPCIAYQAGDNICAGATLDPSQAGLCGFPNGSNDVWYVVQMPLIGSGQLDFNFQGGLTMNDPVVSVYSGCPVSCGGSCTGLTLLSCDDDGGVGLLPYVSLSNPVSPGQYLYVRVHGWAGGRGTFGICVNDPCPSQPANDVPCNATPLAIGNSCNFITASIVCASTNNFGIPAPGCGNYNGRDVWYTFIAPASGAVIIDSRPGSLSDIGFAVYNSSSGNDCTAGFAAPVGCDDNTGTGNMPFLSLTSLTPGRTYWLRIWEDGGNQDGDFDICIYNPCPGGPPANDAPCNAELLSLNNITPGFNNCATAESFTTIAPNSPSCWTHNTPYNTLSFMNTVWYKVVGDTTYTVVVSPLTMTRPQVSIWKPTIGQTCGSLNSPPIRLAGVDVCNNGSAVGCKPSPTSAVITLDGGAVSSYTPNFQATDTLYIGVDGVNGEIGTFEIAVYNTDLNNLPPLAIMDCRRAVPICGIITSVADPGFTNSGNICDLTANTEYKTFTSTATASSNAAGTITLAGGDSTYRLSVGMIITAAGGGGSIPFTATGGTRIISITDATHFVVSPAPSPVLSGTTTITAYIRPTYTSNPPGASSGGTNITVPSTAGLNPGMTITTSSPGGAFPVGTTVVSVTNATTFVASSAPTIGLTGTTVITGTRFPIDSRSTEVNSSWYFFNSTGTAGTMAFDITGNSGTNYDYLLWDVTAGGTFTGQNTAVDGTICAEIRNSGTIYGPPLRANVAYSTGATGVGAAYTTNSSYSAPVNVPASVRTYMLCIINTDGNNSGFTLEFSNFSPINYSASSVVWNDGSGSTNWFDPGNWGSCLAPVCAVHATVQNAPDQPVLTANASVNNLTISAGASLTLMPGVTLSICGNLQNSGSFIAAPTSTVRFVGAVAATGSAAIAAAGQTISGNFTGANKFGNLVIDKPVVATFATTAPSVFQTIPVSSTAGLSVGNAIFLTAGTGAFRMGTTITSIPGVFASPAGAVSNNYATYNSAPGATNAGTTINVASTVGLFPGMVVTVSAGTGAFAAKTYVITVPNATTFQVSVAPTIALSGGAVVTATGSMIGVTSTGTLLPGTLISVTAGAGSFPAGTTATSVVNYASTAGAASSVGTTVTTNSTVGLYPGMMVSMTGGTGVFAAGTVVTSIINPTTFTVSTAPTTALSGATIAAAGFGVSALPSVALSGGATVVSGGPVIGISVPPAIAIGNPATIKAAAGIVSLNTNIDVGRDLTMATITSHLNAFGKNVGVAGNFTNASGNATFNSTGSTLEFNGTGPAQQFVNNGSTAWFDNATGYFVLNNVNINQGDPANDAVELSQLTGTDNNMRINSQLTLSSGRIFTNTAWEVYNRNPAANAVIVNPLCAAGVAGVINPVCNNSYIEGKHTRNVRGGAGVSYTFAVGEGGYAEFAHLKRSVAAGGTTADTLRLRAEFKSWPSLPPPFGPNVIECGLPANAQWSTQESQEPGFWTIDSLPKVGTGSIMGAYDLNLKPNDALTANIGSSIYFSIMKRTPSGSGTWKMDGTCAATYNDPWDVYRNGMNYFSDFAVTQSGSVLPIELLYFNAEQTDEGVLCTWVTSSEINNDYFVVERSYDGKEFVELGKIDGAGNSTTTLNYSFLDKTVCYGLSYYRLKQVDFDGTTAYYDDRVVAVDCKTRNPISLRPNPAQSEIFSEFNMSSDSRVKLEIVDIMGQVVQTEMHDVNKGDNLLKTEISDLAPGVYYMKIIKDGFVEPSFMEKFIKY